ncbi:MAG: nucleoside monophosphate kinase [Acidiferrobacterales bacterium]|nr:nucleoside monophosphate kinase [Acidiferrobacterales bacterium]
MPNPDLEIKDPNVIFNSVWNSLLEEYGRDNMCFPKELLLLGGAPGAGKGTQTRFIMAARGLTCPPIVVSELLTSPEATKLKDAGKLVGDTMVVGLIFRELLDPQYRDGALLDGFPRTRVQVECLKLLVDQLNQLHLENIGTPAALNFRRPVVHAMVLFVTKNTSVERQLHRGVEVEAHNKKVEETGMGERIELRATDLDMEHAEHRYRVFKEQTWDALQSLQEIYHYHFINAEGPIREVEENILQELAYQSSLELEQKTYNQLNPLPLAQEITVHARQDLVKRLDSYAISDEELFSRVIESVKTVFMPIIQRHALSGRASIRSEDTLFAKPGAMAMLIDIFSERGFNAVVDKTIREVPHRFDLETGEIECREKVVYAIDVTFQGSSIRRG